MYRLTLSQDPVTMQFDRIEFILSGIPSLQANGAMLLPVSYREYYNRLDSSGAVVGSFVKPGEAFIPAEALPLFEDPGAHLPEINAMLQAMPDYAGEVVTAAEFIDPSIPATE